MGKPWLKLWTDTLSDRKLRRLNPAEKWCWIGLLLLSAETDDAGRIELADGVPMIGEDFMDALDVEPEIWEPAYAYFLRLGMIAVDSDGFVVVVNYTKRQEPKDPTAAERMRRHRERTSGSVTRNTPVTDNRNVTRNVTPMLRVEAEVEVEAEAEADSKSRQSSTPAQPPAPLTIDLTALPPSLMSLYRDASGEMGQITPTFRGWFDQVTTRYTREQCEQVFRQLSADIAAGKTNGSKWQHTVSLFKSLYETPTKANGIAAPGRSDYDPGTDEELAEARRAIDEHNARLKELEATG